MLSVLLSAAFAAAPPSFPSPEPLVPRDVPCFVRGRGLEPLRERLEAFCGARPSPLADRLRRELGPALNLPCVSAADGTRPWGLVAFSPDDRVWMLPVEDEALFRKALEACLPGRPCRIIGGYALLADREASLERIGPCAKPQDALGGEETDLAARFQVPSGRPFLEGVLDAFPPDVRAVLASGLDQAESLEIRLRLGAGEASLGMTLCPEEGSVLEDRLEDLEPALTRWMGLAPEGAALGAEIHLGTDALEWVFGALGLEGPAWQVLRKAGLGDAALALFRDDEGWSAQALYALEDALDPERIPEVDAAVGVKAGERPYRLDAGDRLLLAAAGKDCAERLEATVPPLRAGLEPRVPEAAAALLSRLPERLNACFLLSPSAWAGPGGGRDLVAVGAAAEDGRLEIRIEIPGEGLGVLYALWQKRKGA